MKVAWNYGYGGFSLGRAAEAALNDPDAEWMRPRDDPDLIAAIEADPEMVCRNGEHVVISEIPDGSHFAITDHDGSETLYYSATPIIGVRHRCAP